MGRVEKTATKPQRNKRSPDHKESGRKKQNKRNRNTHTTKNSCPKGPVG